MPKKDELSRSRYRNLVDHLESLMRSGMKPEYEGYYGQLVLSSDELAELGELDAIRRAAREAGQRLGWKPTTRFVSGRLFVIDVRDVPKDIYERASSNVAERMDDLMRPRPRPVDNNG